MNLPLALTMGEPAGIGPDIAIAAWERRAELPCFYLLADPELVIARARCLDVSVDVAVVSPDQAAAHFQTALPVVALQNRAAAQPGEAAPDNAAAVLEAIRRGVEDVHRRQAAALVTNPINKAVLYAAGFAHPGHTEYLAELAATGDSPPPRPVMMLAGPELRAVPVTIHIPLADAPRLLTTDDIVEVGRIVAHDLRTRFGIDNPRLAVAGLNPHAGEGGALGTEDGRIVAPAVHRLATEGIAVRGPLPADTMFHAAARRTYDAAICMYHDQALIPAKALDFAETVNVTLGLPFVRTSPDHGTAFDIAGTGRADPSSLIAALKLAARMTA